MSLFTTEMVLETFAEASYEHSRTAYVRCAIASGLVVKRLTFELASGQRRVSRELTHHRPEGYLERVREVLDEQEVWTTSALCARLDLGNTRSEHVALGMCMSELGWLQFQPNGQVRGGGRASTVRHYRRSATPVLDKLRGFVHERTVWAAAELAARVGQKRPARDIGLAMRELGFTAVRMCTTKGGRKRWTEYRRP